MEDIPLKETKLQVVKNKIEDVKSIMVNNIDHMLERGERLELLQNKTDSLQENATRFQTSTRAIKNRFCMEQHKQKWILFSILSVIILIIFVMISMRRNNSP